MVQEHTSGQVWQLSGVQRRSVLIDQAVAMLGVSRRTVYYWIHQGRLQTIRTRGGSQRVLLSSMSTLRRSPQLVARPAAAAQSYDVFDSLGA